MNETKSAPSIVGPIIALVIGIVFCYMFVNEFSRESTLKKDGVQTKGKVVDVKESRGRRGRVSYYPVVEFADGQGGTHQFKSSQSHRGIQVGQQVDVTYSASNPDTADISGSGSSWISGLIALVMFGYSGFGMYTFFTAPKIEAVEEDEAPGNPDEPGPVPT